jgi:outer membrane protein TolC
MKTRFFFIYATLFASLPLLLWAQVGDSLITSPRVLAADGRSLQLADLIKIAEQNNPEIEAARRRWQAALNRPAQVSTLPDPMLSYSRWLESVETRVGPQENVFMLSQRIPFPGKLGLQGRMAEQDAVAQGMQYEATRRDVIYKIKTAYYDLYWIDRSLQILDDYQSLLHDFTRVAEQQYTTGVGIQANVLKSQVEISSIMERQLGFAKMRQGVVARINALLNRPTDSPLGVATEIDTSRFGISDSLLIRLALSERQELQATEAMIRKSQYMKSLAKREYLPDFNLQGSYISIPKASTNMFSDAGKDPYSVMVGVNLPIWLGRRNAAVNEAEETIVANQRSYENLANNVKAEIVDFYFQIETTGKTLDLYEQGLIAQAESSLQSALAAYRTGRLDFLNLLDAERMLLQFNLGYVKELANYNKQVAAIERAVGGELPR